MKLLQKSIFSILSLFLLSGCGGGDIITDEVTPYKVERDILENITKDGTYASLSMRNNKTEYLFSFASQPDSKINAHHQIFIDTDRSGESGYVLYEREGLGAEYLLEDGHLFKYTGVGGSNWSWEYIKQFETSDSIPLNTFGTINRFNVQAVVLDKNWDARHCSNVEVFTKTIDRSSHLANLEIDKKFSMANDILNFYFTLSSDYSHRGFFVDSDLDDTTGYAKGYDYLIEDKTLFIYTGTDGSQDWSWQEIDKVSHIKYDNAATTIVPKSIVDNWSTRFKVYAMGYDQDWQEEVLTGSYEYASSLKLKPVQPTKAELQLMIKNGEDVTEVDISKITDMSNLFANEHSFNQDISSWDVSNVTDMNHMFYGTKFNQDISNWDVSNVINMSRMFRFNKVFDQNIGTWDVSNVTNMEGMFSIAVSFNQDLSGWDVSHVTDMSSMFEAAQLFNQNIANWDVSNIINYEDFSRNSALQENYKPSFGN